MKENSCSSVSGVISTRVSAGNHLEVVKLLTISNTGCWPTPSWKGKGNTGTVILPSRLSDNVEHECPGYLYIYHKYFLLSIRCSGIYLDPRTKMVIKIHSPVLHQHNSVVRHWYQGFFYRRKQACSLSCGYKICRAVLWFKIGRLEDTQATSAKMKGIKFRDPIRCQEKYPESSSWSLCVHQGDDFAVSWLQAAQELRSSSVDWQQCAEDTSEARGKNLLSAASVVLPNRGHHVSVGGGWEG